jgi:hypothetical protein
VSEKPELLVHALRPRLDVSNDYPYRLVNRYLFREANERWARGFQPHAHLKDHPFDDPDAQPL